MLDLGRYVAGPYCAGLLAQLGADVIRVEPVRGGEDRGLAPLAAGGVGGLFLQANRGKRGMTLQLGSPAGREILRKLAALADVVVVNLPPPALVELGLDYASLRELKADVILTAVTAFGTTGPEHDRVGFDGVAQAMCGAMHLSGFPGRPVKAYLPYVDYGTALAAALGTLAALMLRERTGRGQQVDASLLGTALCFANSPLAEQAVLGSNRVGTGNRGQVYGPADAFRTRDGFVLVQVIGRPLFERWARLMGEPGWLEDPRFASDASRGDHADVLCERTARWCEGRTTSEALAALGAARIPAGPVLSPQGCLEHPQVRALDLFSPTCFPGIDGPVPVAKPPVRLAASEDAAAPRAPTLGEHTEAILAELGYDAAAIRELRRQGTV